MSVRLSVIIPVFNRASLIAETIKSVLWQTYTNWELIIVDDISTDNTIEVVESFIKQDERIKLIVRYKTQDKGVSSCRNIGLKVAKGEYVVFLDSDDMLANFCLEQRVEAFVKNTKNDFLVFQMKRFSSQLPNVKKKPLSKMQLKKTLSRFIRLEAVWQVTSPIYRKSFLLDIGGFDVRLTNFEDVEIAIKSILVSKEFLVFENIDCFYRNDHNYRAKYASFKSKDNTLKSYTYLLKVIDDEICSKNMKLYFKKDVVASYRKIFLTTIKDNSKCFVNKNLAIIRFLRAKKYLTLKDKVVFYFTHYCLIKLSTIKGIGVFRLMKQLYS